MKKRFSKFILFVIGIGLIILLSGCAAKGATKIKTLIVSKIEIDNITGDFPGEAQLFYEKYCPGEKALNIANLPERAQFYCNQENGVGLLITGEGKTEATLALTAILNDSSFDFSNATIVSVGCAGGNYEYTTLGDVVIVTESCNYELGHTADFREFENKNAESTWFQDHSYDDIAHQKQNATLAEQAYQMTKDIALKTTSLSQQVLKENYPDDEVLLRSPKVLKGTSVTADNYWKGQFGHNNALAVVKAYGCSDPYAVTEMEDFSIARTVACYGMLDQLITLRVVVNLDVFIGSDTPEKLWMGEEEFNDLITTTNSESLDIFEPGMHNLFDVAEIIIDATCNVN